MYPKIESRSQFLRICNPLELGDGKENESNHGYYNTNIIEFVQWVGNEENLDISIQQITLGEIANENPAHSQILVLVGLNNDNLDNSRRGHAAVVNSFIMRNESDIEMTFGDPSPQRIMPIKYINNNTFAWPTEFSGWGFYVIKINKP